MLTVNPFEITPPNEEDLQRIQAWMSNSVKGKDLVIEQNLESNIFKFHAVMFRTIQLKGIIEIGDISPPQANSILEASLSVPSVGWLPMAHREGNLSSSNGIKLTIDIEKTVKGTVTLNLLKGTNKCHAEVDLVTYDKIEGSNMKTRGAVYNGDFFLFDLPSLD